MLGWRESRFYKDVDGKYPFGGTDVQLGVLICRSVPIRPSLMHTFASRNLRYGLIGTDLHVKPMDTHQHL